MTSAKCLTYSHLQNILHFVFQNALDLGDEVKNPFTPAIYYAIAIAITMRFKNELRTRLCDCGDCDCDSHWS